MLTTPALRATPAALGTLVTALLTAGALSLGGATPASATASPTHNSSATSSPAHDHDVVWGTVIAPVDLKIRDAPSTGASIVAKLPGESQDRVECQTRGSSVWGNAYWYWLGGVQGWASAAYVDTGGQHVPSCATSDPCQEYKPCWDTCQGGYNRYH